jgi:glutamate-1-semialdehyde 2,1-aminomutase
LGGEIACVIVEAVAGNMNLIKPKAGFLRMPAGNCTQARRRADLRRGHDRLPRRPWLRAGPLWHHPDLTTLGKVIGGGLPVGAFGGKAEIMDKLAPLGPVYQAGTLSGNPVAVAAGLKTLEKISAPGFYEALTAKTQPPGGRPLQRRRQGCRRPLLADRSAACSASISAPPRPPPTPRSWKATRMPSTASST